jgi:broad specificity phosphatase PhoE
LQLALVRHGETIWTAENRYAGSTDIPLSPRGQQQAEQLGKWAARAGLDGIWVSPSLRTRQTATPAERATGIAVRVDARLREIHYGQGEGLTLEEMAQAFPEKFAGYQSDPVAHHMPDGEDPRDVAQRGFECFSEIERTYPEGRVLVVSHNTLIRATLCRLLGLPLSQYRAAFSRVGNAALTEIQLKNGCASLLYFNLPLDPGYPEKVDDEGRRAV